jgi:hypothetical protein
MNRAVEKVVRVVIDTYASPNLSFDQPQEDLQAKLGVDSGTPRVVRIKNRTPGHPPTTASSG